MREKRLGQEKIRALVRHLLTYATYGAFAVPLGLTLLYLSTEAVCSVMGIRNPWPIVIVDREEPLFYQVVQTLGAIIMGALFLLIGVLVVKMFGSMRKRTSIQPPKAEKRS